MTLDLPRRPALPPCPEPEGYGFGQPLLDALRLREHLLADWRVQVAQAEAVNALAREAELAEALAARNRRIAACQPDPPTVAIPRETLDRAVAEAAKQEPPPTAGPPSGWPAQLPAEGNALERAERYVRWCLDHGAAMPTVGEVNRAVGTSNYIRGAHITEWCEAWKAGR